MIRLQVATLTVTFILVALIHQNAAASSNLVSRAMRLDYNVCQLTPMTTEGPYFIKNVLHRSDIRDGKQGVPLNLTIKVVDGKKCTAMTNFRVDIWQCDALGVYSESNQRAAGERGPGGRGDRWGGVWGGNQGAGGGRGPGGPGGRWPGGNRGPGSRFQPTSSSPSSLFLRGYQSTDGRGLVNFQTIVPGWYPGRSMHIHFEIRTPQDKLIHVGQFYFDEGLSQTIERVQPYTSNRNTRLKNRNDDIFTGSRGDQTIMDIVGDVSGMTSKWKIGVDATVTVPVKLLELGYGPIGFGDGK